MTRVFAFDFDGVLAIPYTQPEVLFPGVVPLLRDIAGIPDNRVVVTSFNPRAYHVLKPLLDAGIIHDIRAGSLTKWWAEGDGSYSDARHRVDMDKALHVQAMLRDVREVAMLYFVDDDAKNVADVTAGSWPCPLRTVLVPSYAGFGTNAFCALATTE